jgi:hypothetical protein
MSEQNPEVPEGYQLMPKGTEPQYGDLIRIIGWVIWVVTENVHIQNGAPIEYAKQMLEQEQANLIEHLRPIAVAKESDELSAALEEVKQLRWEIKKLTLQLQIERIGSRIDLLTQESQGSWGSEKRALGREIKAAESKVSALNQALAQHLTEKPNV